MESGTVHIGNTTRETTESPNLHPNRRRWTMPRLPMPLLVGAMLYALIPCTVLAQHQVSGLPDGEGKTLVESMCTACHPTSQITRSSGYTLAGWKELTGTMLDLSSSPETQDKLMQYLATHFPPNTSRAPTLIPGDTQIAFKELQDPTR